MPISFFNLLSSARSLHTPDQSLKCSTKGCAFPHGHDSDLCEYHIRFFVYPESLTTRNLDWSDIYKLDKDDSRWPLLYATNTSEVFFRPRIRVVFLDAVVRPKDPYKDKDWGAIEAARRFLFADKEFKPLPGKPNRMSVGEVIMPDGAVVKTVRSAPPPNRQQTGAFVLWKGYGKKKVRKSQRMRPQGWHGNHPEQKPRDKWSRETLRDIPMVELPPRLLATVDDPT